MTWNKRATQVVSFEVIFALFVFSGAFKSASYFAFIPIDLTIIFGVVASATATYIFFAERADRSSVWGLVALYAIFVGYATITGLWSPSNSYYLSKAFRLGTVTAFTLGGAAIIIAPSRRRLRRFGAAVFGISVAIAIETVYQFIMVNGPQELTIFGTNYLITGRVIGLGIVLGFYYCLLERPGWKHTIPIALLTVVQMAALGFSGARGPLVTAIGGIGIIVIAGLLLGKLPRSKNAIAAYLTSVIGMIAGAVLVADSVRAIRRLTALTEGPGESLGTRFDYWTWTIDLIGEANFWTGYGLGSWPLYAGFSDEQNYPHNIFLEVLMELGVVGLSLFTLLIGYAFVSIVQGWRRTQHLECIAITALFAYMLVNTFVSGDLNENRYLFAIVGLMVYSPRYPKTDRTVSSIPEMASRATD